MSNGPIEPTADQRVMAATLRGIYLALMQEGFTEHEALTIIGQLLAANAGTGAA
jgi:hypothetical protein